MAHMFETGELGDQEMSRNTSPGGGELASQDLVESNHEKNKQKSV